MASGVKIDLECIHAFNSFKLGKKDSFLIFGFDEKSTQIVVLHREPKTQNTRESWKRLIILLPFDGVRYVVADIDYKISEHERTDMVFIAWAPDAASVRKRMILASSVDALKNSLDGCRVFVQACAYSDLDLKSIVENKFKGSL